MSFTRAALFLLAAVLAAPAHGASCIASTPQCTEWINSSVSGPMGRMRSLVYRSHSLELRNDAITRAVVIVHGGSRDADVNFQHVLAAAFLAGALEDTVIVSPRFASNHEAIAKQLTGEDAVAAARAPARDRLEYNELNWVSQFGSRHWNAGGVASNANVTSYEVIDEILRRLASKDVFPNLKTIVVAGHSSGGQFVSRYQTVNRVHEQLGVKVTYLVSNPGAYTYLDEQRPTAAALSAAASGAMPAYFAAPGKPGAAFAPYPDGRHCTTYNDWPYGIQNRVAYAASATDDQLKKQAVSRPTTFLLGQLDVLPLVNFDISCNAVSQGNSRLARGLAFSRYLRENYSAQHKTIVVEGCGHHTRCMLTTNEALPLLFPKD